MSHPTLRRFGLALSLVAAAGSAAAAGTWRVERGVVRVVCPLTVGGSFEARTPSLTGTLTSAAPDAPLDGDLTVDLRTLDTGIELRNAHMLGTYLEVDKSEGFDRAVLSRIRMAGDPASSTGSTRFSGELRLHGVTKPIEGEATISHRGTSMQVTASFPVVLADHGIAPPRYLGVGVRDRVQVHVSFRTLAP